MKKRNIKHNDLTHYFLRPHEQLPRAYLASCRKFLNSIQDRLITKKDAAYLFKHQASSTKLQAAGSPAGFFKKKKRFDNGSGR